MRFATPSLLIGCVALALAGDAHATSWTSAKFPGEQDRAVQGCADDAQNPGDWFCIFVRCDQPRSPLTLHFSTPGPDIHGDVKLVIDEDTFAVSVPASLKSALPLSTRAETMSDALIEAMKAGSAISVQVPPSVAIQSNFIAELAQGHRKNREGLCTPISQRRKVLAAPDAKPALLLILPIERHAASSLRYCNVDCGQTSMRA